MKSKLLIKLFSDSIKSKGKNIAKERQFWMLERYTNYFLKVLSVTIKHVILYDSSLLRWLHHEPSADCQLILHILYVLLY